MTPALITLAVWLIAAIIAGIAWGEFCAFNDRPAK